MTADEFLDAIRDIAQASGAIPGTTDAWVVGLLSGQITSEQRKRTIDKLKEKYGL